MTTSTAWSSTSASGLLTGKRAEVDALYDKAIPADSSGDAYRLALKRGTLDIVTELANTCLVNSVGRLATEAYVSDKIIHVKLILANEVRAGVFVV